MASNKNNSATKKYFEQTNEEILNGVVEKSQQGQDILAAYQAGQQNQNSIENRALNQQLEANKAYDLSQKYLAAQNQANGLGGLGIADTTSLRASSQYQNALADAYATKEKSSLENYQSTQDEISTIRGEWASKQEAEKQIAMDNVLSATDFEAAKAYLKANGIESGSAEYDKALSNWALANGYSVGANGVEAGIQASVTADAEKKKTLEDYGLSLGEDGNITNQSFNPKTVSGKTVSDHYDWNNYFWIQSKALDELFGQSKSWTSDKNGTYVDFNDGAGEKIFVFYDGLWYETNLSRKAIKAAGKKVNGVDSYSTD